MEACCSLNLNQLLHGGICGFDLRDRKQNTQIIPLITCTKDISKHKTTYNFSGIENEIEQILWRVSFLRPAKSVNDNMPSSSLDNWFELEQRYKY
jgi:hypothetical protein